MIGCNLLLSVPGQPHLITENGTSSISLTWSYPSGSEVTSILVEWSSNQCSGDGLDGNTLITDGSTNYDILNLRSDTSYTLSLTARNSAGSSPTEQMTVYLEETGKYTHLFIFAISHLLTLLLSQCPLLLP